MRALAIHYRDADHLAWTMCGQNKRYWYDWGDPVERPVPLNLTDDWLRVTCKRCIKRQGALL